MVAPRLDMAFPFPDSPDDVKAPAGDNTAAVLSYGGVGDWCHLLAAIHWSYAGSGTLAGGNLLVQDGSDTVFSQDITSQGAGFAEFNPPKRISAGGTLTITLAAGGSNVTGKVNALHWMMPYNVGSPGLYFNVPFASQYLPLI